MTEPTNEELKEMLRQAWAMFTDSYLLASTPDNVKRQRNFIALDRKMREHGLIGPKK